MAAHVGLSLIVLQIWMRGGMRWLLLAIALHSLVNAVAAILVLALHLSPLIGELVLVVLALGRAGNGVAAGSAGGGVRRPGLVITCNSGLAGFHQDEEEHWVAELECGHGQHVRHDPPWQVRTWVTTEAKGGAAGWGRCWSARSAMKVALTALEQ